MGRYIQGPKPNIKSKNVQLLEVLSVFFRFHDAWESGQSTLRSAVKKKMRKMVETRMIGDIGK
ncbi:MAG: hypothetical protein COA70_09645 [Planctomycetota bacterium]|nr:MAG: hypothetical protein COA70_09645 [Planctomycetota bacterium]